MRRPALLVLPLLVATGFFAAQPAFAQLPTLVPEACRGTAELEECGLNEAVQVFINVAQFIFGISGAVALLMFVWGGFLWLTSAGSAEKVKQGQAVITGAVIGLLIIFGAYVGVQFVVGALRGTVAPGEVMIPGERCGSGEAAGLAVYTGRETTTSTGGLECITDCGSLSDLGYGREDLREISAADYECIDGLFPDEEEPIKCCRARAGGSGSTGTGEGPSSPPEGTSGRNNCRCANTTVSAQSTCALCAAFCESRDSTLSQFNGEPLTRCP
ncbi:hypothetical protein EPO33_04050 [Patescibacteria group bacterium]|nr:MAG: hypothetical protein EPO33_04050 [Patescibacteria group bacterium]